MKSCKLSIVRKSTVLVCLKIRRLVESRHQMNMVNNKKDPMSGKFSDLNSAIFSQNKFKKLIKAAWDS